MVQEVSLENSSHRSSIGGGNWGMVSQPLELSANKRIGVSRQKSLCAVLRLDNNPPAFNSNKIAGVKPSGGNPHRGNPHTNDCHARCRR